MDPSKKSDGIMLHIPENVEKICNPTASSSASPTGVGAGSSANSKPPNPPPGSIRRLSETGAFSDDRQHKKNNKDTTCAGDDELMVVDERSPPKRMPFFNKSDLQRRCANQVPPAQRFVTRPCNESTQSLPPLATQGPSSSATTFHTTSPIQAPTCDEDDEDDVCTAPTRTVFDMNKSDLTHRLGTQAAAAFRFGNTGSNISAPVIQIGLSSSSDGNPTSNRSTQSSDAISHTPSGLVRHMPGVGSQTISENTAVLHGVKDECSSVLVDVDDSDDDIVMLEEVAHNTKHVFDGGPKRNNGEFLNKAEIKRRLANQPPPAQRFRKAQRDQPPPLQTQSNQPPPVQNFRNNGTISIGRIEYKTVAREGRVRVQVPVFAHCYPRSYERLSDYRYLPDINFGLTPENTSDPHGRERRTALEIFDLVASRRTPVFKGDGPRPVGKPKMTSVWRCPICDLNVGKRQLLLDHLNTHYENKPFPCTYDGCNDSFTTLQGMKRHAASHKPVTERDRFLCSDSSCDREFNKVGGVMDHMDGKKTKCKKQQYIRVTPDGKFTFVGRKLAPVDKTDRKNKEKLLTAAAKEKKNKKLKEEEEEEDAERKVPVKIAKKGVKRVKKVSNGGKKKVLPSVKKEEDEEDDKKKVTVKKGVKRVKKASNGGKKKVLPSVKKEEDKEDEKKKIPVKKGVRGRK